MIKLLRNAALCGALLMMLMGGVVVAADCPDKSAIDWDRARTLFERDQRGEKLSADDQAYLERAKTARRDAAANPAAQQPPAAGDVDLHRAAELKKKAQNGEALTPDEQEYLRRAQEKMHRPEVGPMMRGNPFGNAIPPEFVLRHADELKLDESQVQFIREEIQKAQERFPEMQRNLSEHVAALSEQMRAEKVDQEKAIGLLDKVLDAEREIKRSQLILNLKVRNKLTLQQREQLQQFASEPPQHRVPELLQRLQQQVRKLQEQGGDVSAVQQILQQAQSKLQAGQFREAEILLSQAAGSLHDGKKE